MAAGWPEVIRPIDREALRDRVPAADDTVEAPAGGTGDRHTTIFRARPDEAVGGRLMRVQHLEHRAKDRATSLLGR